MSRIDIQSLLNQQPVPPNVSPIPSKPDFKQSQLTGGQVRLGQAQQQIGPTPEMAEAEQLKALADIAGGVETAIGTFTKISQIEDKKKIETIETEFDKIDQTDLTPEEKKEKLDELLRNVWTPVTGTGWKDKIATNANRRWLSEEGQNAFEEKRYRREFVRFLNEKRNVTKADTPELEEIFQREYSSRYPTSEYNNWYRLKTFTTNSQLIQKKVQDAVALFPLSIDAAFQIPNEEQRNSALLGNTEVRANFKTFFDLLGQANLSPSPESFALTIKKTIEDDIIAKLDPNTPIEVQQELARQVPVLALQKAKQIMDAAADFKLDQAQQDAFTSIGLAEKNLESSENKLQAVSFYLDTLGRHLNTLNIPRSDKRDAVYKIIPTIVGQMDAAITQGTDRTIVDKFPEWQNMTAVERVDAAVSVFNEWVNTGQNKQRIMEILDFKPEEIRGLTGTPEQAAEQLVIQNARISALLSPSIQKRFQEETGRAIQDVSFTGDSLSAYNSTEQITKAVNESLETIASKLGVSVKSLRNAYRDDEGNKRSEVNLDKWFQSLSVEERNEVVRKGHNLGNFESTLKYIDAARKLELSAEKTAQQKKFSGDSSVFDVDKISKQAIKFSPTTNHSESDVRPSLAIELLTGKAGANAENREFIVLLHQYRNARDNLRTNTRLSEEEKQKLKGFVDSVKSELGFMDGYADAVDKAVTEMFVDVPRIVRQIPTPSANSPRLEEATVEIAKEFQEQSEAVFTGVKRVDLKSQPGTIIDQNGTWSKEATFNLLSASFMTKRVFSRDARDEDKKLFNETIDNAMNRIANGGPDYLQSQGGKYDLTLLATIGTTFRQESVRTGTNPQIHNADYFVRRAAILGNWANETDVEKMLVKLNSEDSRGFIDANLRVPLALAATVRGDVKLAATYEQTGGAFVREQTFRDKNAIRVASALGAQMQPYIADPDLKREIPGQTINANSIDWDPEELRKKLELALDEPVTMDQLAKSFRGLLTGFNELELSKMKPEEQVRAAVQVINSVTEGNEGILRDTVGFIFGDYGLNNESLQPLKGETKLGLFTAMLSTSLGMQHQYILNQRNIDLKIGSTPTVPIVISRGSVIQPHPETNEITVTSILQPTTIVYGNNYSTTFSGAPLTTINSSLFFSGVGPRVLDELKKLYPPEPIERKAAIRPKDADEDTPLQQIDVTGSADGLMFILGTVSLEAKVPPDLRARFSVVEEWALAHGIKSPEQMMMKTFVESQPGIARPSAETAAKQALREVLTDDTLTLKEMLERLNTKYLSLGGSTPLFNATKYKPSTPGFSELVQQQNTHVSRESKLPTYRWSGRSVRGVPFIKLTDAYYYKELTGEGKEESRFLMIENYLADRKEQFTKEDKAYRQKQFEIIRQRHERMSY